MKIKKKNIRILLLFLGINIFFPEINYAQYTGNIWCFGDSSGIDFNSNPPSTFKGGTLGRSSAASICDNNGNLLFYCNGFDYYLWNSGIPRRGIVKDRNNQTMSNGEQLLGKWYHDMVIIPKSEVDSTFYILSCGVTSDFGLFYSVVDLKLQNGLGEVVQKNIQLQTFPVFDGLTTVKHGNGKDWWLLFQRWDPVNSTSNSEFYVYRIDSGGIQSLPVQFVGDLQQDGSGDVTFNSDGSKFVYVGWGGLVEIYDFDRCTGIISNPIQIEPLLTVSPFPYYASCVFSPDNRFLYLPSCQDGSHSTSFLYQFDLNSANIGASKLIIDSFPYPEALSSAELAPDNKIYITTFDEQYNFPFADSVHSIVTDFLSVINSPDSLGAACDFQKYSFYLGGNCTYFGLPNNPDYTLGPLVGSPCDTITAVHSFAQPKTNEQLKIFYHPGWDIAFINADKLSGRKYTFTVFDITGKENYTEKGNLQPPYFTKDFGMQSFSKGVYIVVLQSERERITGRFVKY